MPALTLRPAPLPWVAALRALPAVVIAVAGGAWLALAVGVGFGVDLSSGAAVWIGLAGACACVSGWMVGSAGSIPAAAVLSVAAIGAVVLAVQTHSGPVHATREIVGADVAPETHLGEPRSGAAARPRSGAAARPRSGAAAKPRSGAAAPLTVVAAGKLVRSYYAAIDAGDFAAAWNRLSPAVQAGFGGFAVWRGGYATTLDQRVEAVEVDGTQIRHVLVARDRTPCGGTVEQRFAVVWTMAAGKAASLHAVRLAGQDPAAAC
ncbi:MAG TPA: hypothetical protein VFX51_10325 [Solirubrobacteraceae bacterium]|nr:hypothetical protein [Solirubrobacteraceae bacterium]